MVPKQRLEALVKALDGGVRVRDMQLRIMVTRPQPWQIISYRIIGCPGAWMLEMAFAIAMQCLFRKELPPSVMPASKVCPELALGNPA